MTTTTTTTATATATRKRHCQWDNCWCGTGTDLERRWPSEIDKFPAEDAMTSAPGSRLSTSASTVSVFCDRVGGSLCRLDTTTAPYSREK